MAERQDGKCERGVLGYLVIAVDKDRDQLKLIKDELPAHGLSILPASTIKAAHNLILTGQADLLIVDLETLEDFGLGDLIENQRLPYVVSSWDTDEEIIEATLNKGADHYQAKPFNPRVLATHIRAILRRRELASATRRLSAGGLELDLDGRIARRNGLVVSLTRIESRLLEILVNNCDRVVTYTEIAADVWGDVNYPSRENISQRILCLRRKLQDGCSEYQLIRTVLKTGYVLETPSDKQAVIV